MADDEKEYIEDPKTDKKVALWVSAIITLLFTFCVVDLQTNLGIGDKILVNICGEEIIQQTQSEALKSDIKIKKGIQWPELPSPDDKFEDLQAIVDRNNPKKPYKNYRNVVIKQRFDDPGKSMQKALKYKSWDDMTPLDYFQMQIRQHAMYPEDDTIVKKVLRDLVNLPIIRAYEKSGGTQFKMILTFSDESRAHAKPWRMDREEEANINHFYFNDFERHNAEIAAYHLDKVLGFRRSIPHVGRIVNLTSEIYPNADEKLYDTFYISPDNNVCMTGHCDYYCNSNHPICGSPDTIEIAMGAHLPRYEKTERKVWRNPWRRSYSKRRKVQWQYDEEYCEIIKKIPPYNGTRMLDMMDMHIFDFFIGNQDRHHYETFKIFGNETFTIFLDHGRTFGWPNFDDLEILLPVFTCCMIRDSTLKTLLKYHTSKTRLSDAFRESMSDDPITPVLSEKHLKAVDRRASIVLQAVRNCLKKHDSRA